MKKHTVYIKRLSLKISINSSQKYNQTTVTLKTSKNKFVAHLVNNYSTVLEDCMKEPIIYCLILK